MSISVYILNTSLCCLTSYLYIIDHYDDSLLHRVSKNDNDVAHYNFNAHQPILIIFGRDIAE